MKLVGVARNATNVAIAALVIGFMSVGCVRHSGQTTGE
jgi:hypothetical protein